MSFASKKFCTLGLKLSIRLCFHGFWYLPSPLIMFIVKNVLFYNQERNLKCSVSHNIKDILNKYDKHTFKIFIKLIFN